METQRFDVVVAGELNPDLILSGDVWPEFGQVEKLVDEATLHIGSSSAIFACGAAQLGLKVAFIGKVGRDLFGDFMRQSLAGYGIDTRGIIDDEKTPTGISVILSRGNDRAILTYPGTIPRLAYSEINTEILQQARLLHVGSYYIQDDLRPDLPRLFTEAHNWGLSISLDTNYDPTGKWDKVIGEILPKVDLFLPNTVECMGIAGVSSLEQALNQLETKVKYLAVKCGDAGAILCHNGKKYEVKPIQVEVVDTVGAGDSFDAGFIYGYLAGWEPGRMLKLANICGGLSTRQAGGTGAQPSLDEAMQYL